VVLAGLLIIVLTFVGLNLYTRHGQGFEVPDFTGLTEQQSIHLIEKNELRYAIIDSVYLDDMPPGVVVEQTPNQGSLVKKNRTIFFTINAWAPEKVLMPDVIDYSIRNARVMLESYGLNVGEIIYVPSEYTNLVLGQHYNGKPIEPGSPLERETNIDLIVGQGLSNKTTAVPHLIGLNIDDAKEINQSVSLNIGAKIYDSSIQTQEDTLNAFIWKQWPEASQESQLQLGASIDIWLTTDSSHIAVDSTMISSPDSTDIEKEIDADADDEFNEEEKFF
jgi:beta-lactam-binding protein with PASTA domain